MGLMGIQGVARGQIETFIFWNWSAGRGLLNRTLRLTKMNDPLKGTNLRFAPPRFGSIHHGRLYLDWGNQNNH